MGDYNPHWHDGILGMEWAPAKDETVLLTMDGQFEIGHEFDVLQTSSIAEFMTHVPFWPTQGFTGVISSHIYPLSISGVGYEGRPSSGPIKRILIPPSDLTVSGTGAFIDPESTGPQGYADEVALTSPADFIALIFDFDQSGITTIPNRAWIGFKTDAYKQLLVDKRILAVNFVYSAYTQIITGATDEQEFRLPLNAPPLALRFISASSRLAPSRAVTNVSTDINAQNHQGSVLSFDKFEVGTHNYFSADWEEGLGSADNLQFQSVQEWDHEYLERFSRNGFGSSVYRIEINDQFQELGPDNQNRLVIIDFAALEILYCEEQRVARGATMFESEEFYIMRGVNPTYLEAPITLDFPVDILPGRYLATIGSGHVGVGTSFDSLSRTFPEIQATRELIPIDTHPGKEIVIPLIENEQFQERDTHTMVQLSVHLSDTFATRTHVYGRRIEAPVYEDILRVPQQNIYAQQDILNPSGTDLFACDQARYYARRFGNSGDLILTCLSGPSITGSTASISTNDFDELPEIIDGFKEVNLRFDFPVVLPHDTTAVFRWTSPDSKFGGDRWEILGASAIMITGATPKVSPDNVSFANTYATNMGISDYLRRIDGDRDTSFITYFADEGESGTFWNGSIRGATWHPGIAPLISGVAFDETSDLVLLISPDPPMVSGFGVSVGSQELTTFAECGHGACCVPSSMYYHVINWLESGIQVTGFGAYELQRSDDYTEWHTIMLASDRSVTSFNDYESRVGVTSRYRIRQLNALNFAGFWSITGESEITGVGAELPACGAGKEGLIFFTSNENQDGSSNLAYAPIWESGVNEDFENIEASNVEILRFHDRDYQTAFHGTERGGDAFTRTLLLSNAAVAAPPKTVPKSLIDLAWDTLSYVCVRDDAGDRWFSNISIPASSMRRNRRLQMVEIAVTEVTATPTEVDP